MVSSLPHIEGVDFEMNCPNDGVADISPRFTNMLDEIRGSNLYAMVASYRSASARPELLGKVEINSDDISADANTRPRTLVVGDCIAIRKLGGSFILDSTKTLADLNRRLQLLRK